MVPYLGDFSEDATVRFGFNTFSSNDPSASVTITDLVDADLKVHKDGGTTEIATDGATIAINFDGVTGNHLVTIDTSAHADYSTGSDYMVRMEGTTVDGATVNAWIGHFSIENRFVRVDEIAANAITATAINADAITAAKIAPGAVAKGDQLTGLTDLSAAQVNTEVDTALSDYDPPTKAEIDSAFTEIKGATWASGTDTLEHIRNKQTDIETDTAEIGVAGAGLTNINLPNQTMDITGSLSGSVGSVTGAVGSVAGNVDGNVSGTVLLANGAHGGAAAAITLADYSDFTGAGATNPNVLLSAEVATVSTQTEFTLATGSDEDDAYNDQAIVLYDDTNSDYPSVRKISDYVGATLTITIDSAPDFTLGTDDSVRIFVTAPGTVAPTAAQNRAEMDSNSTQLAAIVGDTSELQTDDIPGLIAALNDPTAAAIRTEIDSNSTQLAAIVADSSELQADWANGGRLDLLIDAIKAVTDALPNSGALTDLSTAAALATVDTVVDAIKVVTDALTAAAAAKLALSAGTIVSGAASAGTLSTTQMTTNLTEVTNDHYNGRIIIWTSGVLQNQATDITDYDGASKMFTFTAVTEAPTATDTFVVV